MKKSIFAECNGQLYVQVAAVMHPLCAYVDGLSMHLFEKDKKAYLDIDTAIAWCRKEAESHSPDKYMKMIEVMERAKQQEATEVSR